MAQHHVVIVGGGFAGLAAAKTLGNRDLKVTLVDRRNFHLFQPLLYQVATGGLSPADICAPIRAVLRSYKNVQTILAEVTGFDLAAKKVLLSDGELAFDSLIVAAGARHHYFGNEQWEPLAPGLKSIEDATAIRRKILSAFENAERETDVERRRAWLTFVVVGGGPTGVELAGALGEIANDTLKEDFRTCRPEESQILLLDAGDRILSNFPSDLGEAAEKALLQLGVRCLNRRYVTAVDEDGVTIKSKDKETSDRITSKTVIWAAGVKGSPLAAALAQAAGLVADRAGRIPVTQDCSLAGFPNVFALGDMAAFTGADGNPLPGVAPVAMQQGPYVAKLILNRLANRATDPFRYTDKGNLATIGRHSAVADFGRFHATGWFAWMLWLLIHLMFLVGFQNRLQVFIQWAFQYMSFNRNARLITANALIPKARTAT
jgi:NADH:ubiquinone reductase (H+-translocating)